MSSTKNNQPYFPHYANSRNEDNMVRLRMAHGVAGYGVYHMLLERLRMSEGYKCELDYKILSWDLDCSEDLIRSVIYDFGLFEIIDDGQKFSSIELNAYMRLMEEKAAERREKAQAAANARWGNKVAQAAPIAPEVQAQLPLNIDDQEKESGRLDREIEEIKADANWQEHMAKESGKTKEEIVSYLDDFRTACILKGIKRGHKDMIDALSHFRSWIYKSGRAKEPRDSQKRFSGTESIRGNNTYRATDIHRRLDSQTAERNAAYEDWENKKADIRLYIMNKGYDPSKVTMVQLAQPNWAENNPPTHPEWIGAFEEPVELPY